MTVPIYLVDAFTAEPFRGNPAAVCLLPAWRDDRWLQQVAAEFNLSETAFLVRGGGGYDLRWFTPTVEVDLCGHATLASACVLWDSGADRSDRIAFATRSGVLSATRRAELIELDFPVTAPEPTAPPPRLLESLGVSAIYVGQTQFDCFVETGSETVLRAMRPDFVALAAVSTRGVIVTCRSHSPEFDFVSRFFAPASGINEDPVTGSAHCALADYWGRKLGKTDMVGFQASERGGVVRVQLAGDRVRLAGRAVIVVRGQLSA